MNRETEDTGRTKPPHRSFRVTQRMDVDVDVDVWIEGWVESEEWQWQWDVGERCVLADRDVD